ncbi:hypothetical protein AB4Y32_16140 [Paraburkholderia phymatum]|uniref:Uncharacterized protein n=1 Tax=Paraburkholderia phymatum TaxID=148447 RepID=A0ACC6U140_9BURK
MSKASEALDALRQAGMKIRTPSEALDRLRECMKDEDPVVDDEDLTTPAIHYTYEEFPVRSIKVMEMNFGHVKLELVDVEKNEEEIEATIRMLVEAICMLREEIGEIRLQQFRDDCPF